MPGSNSDFDLSERREIAYEKFSRGWSIRKVAQYLNVSEDTASRYKKEYEDRIEALARANPGMLLEVIQNTIRALEENDQVRAHAWEEYEAATVGREIECDHCGSTLLVPGTNATVRNQFLKTILTAQEQRSKLFGLFGVKAEFFSMVQQVRLVQEKLLEFMARELCRDDRDKLETYLQNELGVATQAVQMVPMIPANLLSEN